MHPSLFKIGPITIYTYGFFVFLGVISGYLVAAREAKRCGIDKNIFSNIAFWTLIWSFLGAKLLYILVEFKYFLKNPLSVIRSGFAFYGGIIAGAIALYLLTKKYKIKFMLFADIVAIAIPLGHALGRLGCFFYGCCYGKSTSSFIGILFPPDSPAGYLGVKVIPTQLISSFFLFLLFFSLLALRKKKKFDGQIALYYIVFYSIFRFIIEFFRGDPRGMILFLSTSQFISLILIMVSIFFWARPRRQP